MGKNRIGVGGLLLIAIALSWPVTAMPTAATTEPTIGLSSPTAQPGDLVIVTLTGWNVGPVTVSVCGNEAARGSEDCDLRSAQGVGIANPTTETVVQLMVARPPPPCPCVVMVATAAHDIVRSVPIEIKGVPIGPVIGSTAPGPLFEVKASVEAARSTVVDRLKASAGGRVRRTLVLVVKNNGTMTANQISATAAVGRAVNGGEPLALPAIGPLQPGEAKRYRVLVTLAAPSYGHYAVSGTLTGYGVPVAFVARTSTVPVLLVVLCLGLAVDIALLVSLRARRRYRMRRGATTATGVVPAANGKTAPARSAPAKPVFFQSRRAAVATCTAVAALLVVVYIAAKPSTEGGPGAGEATQSRSQRRGTTVPVNAKAAASLPHGANGLDEAPTTSTVVGPANTLAPAAVPADIAVHGNANLRDGQEVQVQVTAKRGSEIFGFEIRLCAAEATFRFDSDMRPTQGGKCIAKPLSVLSDDYQEVRAIPPFKAVETTFHVGVGTDRYSTSTGRAVTIMCGPGHPCQLALKIQYPDGFAFRSYPVTYA